jgi:glucose/arabinose dehydrogenase
LRATPIDTVNFSETTFLSSGTLTNTTSFAWAPDGSGRMFITQKGGACYIVQHGFQASNPTGTLVATPFMTESVFTSSECGLLGVAFDPGYVTNHYVYFFATKSSSEQQIIRYTDNANVGTNRTVIMPGLPTLGANHDGGGIGFGADGKLYWSIGDNGSKVGVDNNLTSLCAKVGRANRDGSVPNDNPFFDGAGPNNDYIWGRGFRNPFTMTFQPGTGQLFLNVVGSTGSGQTIPNSGPGYEQVFLVHRGDHGGYDDWENNQPAGYITPAVAYTTAAPTVLSIAAAPNGLVRSNGVVTVTTTNTNVNTHPFRRGGRVVIATSDSSFSGAFFVSEDVSHQVFRFVQAGLDATAGTGTATSTTYGDGSSGAAISGGHFYDSTAFLAAYRGNFFFGDYISGKMARATLDAANNVTSVDLFANNLSGLIDIGTGPDGALYYQGIGSGTIRRLAATSTAQNVIVQPTAFNVLEGSTGIFTVRLAAAPAANVTVTLSRLSGDTDLSVSSASSLTFTPANYFVPQLVTIAAAEDADVDNDSAVFRVFAPGIATYDVAVNGIDNDDPQLVVSTPSLSVNEGGSNTFTVRLANVPAGNTSVSVARTAGDTDVTVSGGASLTFTTGNYSTPQTVTIAAAEDADNTNDSATITVSTAGQPSRSVAVTVLDNDPLTPAFTSSPILTAVQGAAYTYDANASGNPLPTFSLTTAPAGMSIDAATGVINWTPTSTGNFGVTVQAANGILPNATQPFTIAVSADAPPTAVITRPAAGEVVSGTNAEFFGNGVDDVSTVKAEFFVDGVLKFTDTNNENHFHYGGSHLLFDTTQFTNGAHTLRMRVTDTKGQTGQQDVQITIGNGGDSWRAQYFDLNDPTDLANSQFGADPDRDDVVNLFEYFTDSLPKTADVTRSPKLEITNIGGTDYLSLRFVRANWATDVQALVEATGNLLGAWTQIDPSNPTYQVSLQNNTPAFGLQTFVIRDVVPMGTGPRFMRLRLTK